MQRVQTLILQHRLQQNGQFQKYGDQKLVETPSKYAFFLIKFSIKPNDFIFVTWFISILKFGLPRLSLEVFRTKIKTKLFEPFQSR